jgi:hypothetical protein
VNKPIRLLDEIRNNKKGLGGPTCTVKVLEQTFTPDDYADLLAAFSEPLVPTSAIWRALDQRGINVSQGALQRHRRGECRCGRAE